MEGVGNLCHEPKDCDSGDRADRVFGFSVHYTATPHGDRSRRSAPGRAAKVLPPLGWHKMPPYPPVPFLVGGRVLVILFLFSFEFFSYFLKILRNFCLTFIFHFSLLKKKMAADPRLSFRIGETSHTDEWIELIVSIFPSRRHRYVEVR
jgi:hypothetical protein